MMSYSKILRKKVYSTFSASLAFATIPSSPLVIFLDYLHTATDTFIPTTARKRLTGGS